MTTHKHSLLTLLCLAVRHLDTDRERILSSPMFNGGSPTAYGTIRMWVDTAGDVYVEDVDSRYGTTTMSTADTDATIAERWLGIPGCPDGVLGEGD